MRYKFEIRSDMEKDELSKELEDNYGYPLLNFAYVIAEVLAENTVFIKTIDGRKISDIKKDVNDLKKIKQKLIKSLDDYCDKYYKPYNYYSLIKNNPEFKKVLYSSAFKLEAFFGIIDEDIKQKKERINEYVRKPTFPFPWPDSTKSSRAISYANQVSFLWSSSLHKGDIHWRNICDLILWFLEYLKDSIYGPKLFFKRKEEITGYPKVLKNQYRRIKLLYMFPLMISSQYIHFPIEVEKPVYPKEQIFFSDPKKACLVISVEFYKKKIKTIFKEENKLKVKETIFKQGKPYSKIRDYEEREEQEDADNLLLDIS